MKKGQFIAKIRRLARRGKPFPWYKVPSASCFAASNAVPKTTVQAMLNHLARKGELKVVRRGGPRQRTLYCAGEDLLSVDTLQPGRWVGPPPVEQPESGEITLKQWIAEEAERTCMSFRAIEGRFGRGKYPNLPIRRVNSRTIFVKP